MIFLLKLYIQCQRVLSWHVFVIWFSLFEKNSSNRSIVFCSHWHQHNKKYIWAKLNILGATHSNGNIILHTLRIEEKKHNDRINSSNFELTFSLLFSRFYIYNKIFHWMAMLLLCFTHFKLKIARHGHFSVKFRSFNWFGAKPWQIQLILLQQHHQLHFDHVIDSPSYF